MSKIYTDLFFKQGPKKSRFLLNLTDRHMDKHSNKRTDSLADLQTDRQTNKQTDKQTDGQTNRRTNNKIDRPTVKRTNEKTDEIIIAQLCHRNLPKTLVDNLQVQCSFFIHVNGYIGLYQLLVLPVIIITLSHLYLFHLYRKKKTLYSVLFYTNIEKKMIV